MLKPNQTTNPPKNTPNMPNPSLSQAKLTRFNINLKNKKTRAILGMVVLFIFSVGLGLALVLSKKSTENRSQASGNQTKLTWAKTSVNFVPDFSDPDFPNLTAVKDVDDNNKDFFCVSLVDADSVLGFSGEIQFDPEVSFIKVEPQIGSIKGATEWSQLGNKVRFFVGTKPEEAILSNNDCALKVRVWAKNQNLDGNGQPITPAQAPSSIRLALANFQVVSSNPNERVVTVPLEENKTITFTAVNPNTPTNTPTPTPIHQPPSTTPRPTNTPSATPTPTEGVAECAFPAALGSLTARHQGQDVVFNWNAGSCQEKINSNEAYVWWQVIDVSDNKTRIAASWTNPEEHQSGNTVTNLCTNRAGHRLRMDAFVSEVNKGYNASYQRLMDDASYRQQIIKSVYINCPNEDGSVCPPDC